MVVYESGEWSVVEECYPGKPKMYHVCINGRNVGLYGRLEQAISSVLFGVV